MRQDHRQIRSSGLLFSALLAANTSVGAQEYIPPPSGPWTLSPVIVQESVPVKADEPAQKLPSFANEPKLNDNSLPDFHFPPAGYSLLNAETPVLEKPPQRAEPMRPESPSSIPSQASGWPPAEGLPGRNPWAAPEHEEPVYSHYPQAVSRPYRPGAQWRPQYAPQYPPQQTQTFNMPNPWNMMPMQPFMSFTP